MAKTSDRVSTIAARLIHITAEGLLKETDKGYSHAENLAEDIRTLAASALRQDEHKGFRGTIARLLSRKK